MALAFLLACPWSDAIASAGSTKMPAAPATPGKGWRRPPTPAPSVVLSAQGEDYDEADDGAGMHSGLGAAFCEGGVDRWTIPEGAPAAAGPGRSPPGPWRFETLCRLRC